MAESAAVRVEKSPTCGRKLVATSTFSPGRCILEELEPYAYTLLDSKRGFFCDFCLKQCSQNSTLECPQCNYVSYCNKSCQEGDWKRCHEQDCKTLNENLSLPHHSTLLLSQIFRKQKNYVPCTLDEDGFPTTVDKLEYHYDELIEKLKRLKEFDSTLSQFKEWIDEDNKTLLNMFGASLCNGFSIMDNDLIDIANGIYLRASMANHSCDPNCEVVFDGMKLQIRSIKDIKEGEECTISYGEVMNPAEERQAELENKYYFTCKCVKCLKEIDESGPDDGLGEESKDHLKKSWEQVQNQKTAKDLPKVLQLCEPFLKPMDSPSANHHLLVKLRYKAFEAFVVLQKWNEAAVIGRLNTKPYKHHYGPYSASLGVYLLRMSQILLDLKKLDEAKEYFMEAEEVLKVTHGRQHSLMLTSVQDVREHLA